MKLQSDRYTTGEKALTREEYDTLVKVITDLQDELMIRLGGRYRDSEGRSV
jgi:hypothetical protein